MRQVLLCHLTGKLITKNFMGKAVRGLIQGSLGKGKMVDGLLSNALVTKMVQKRMQGKAGLGTKMVLPSTPQQASLTWTAVPAFRVRCSPSIWGLLQSKTLGFATT